MKVIPDKLFNSFCQSSNERKAHTKKTNFVKRCPKYITEVVAFFFQVCSNKTKLNYFHKNWDAARYTVIKVE